MHHETPVEAGVFSRVAIKISLMNVLKNLAVTLLLAACATSPPPPAATAVAALTPTGNLRVGMPIYDVFVGARDTRSASMYSGVAPEMAQLMAAALGVSLTFVPYADESALSASIGRNEWDIAFIAFDRRLASAIDFSRPFMAADFTYVVAANDARFRAIGDADRLDARIAAAVGSAANELLAQRYPAKQFVPVPAGKIAMNTVFRVGRADAYAESAHILSGMTRQESGFRVLDGSYAVQEYVVAIQKDRPAGLAYVNAFLDFAKASGEIEKSIRKAGLIRVNVVARGSAP